MAGELCELWSLSNENWTIPLWVDWPEAQQDICTIEIGAGINLLELQKKAAAGRLKEIGGEFYNDCWNLGRENLERFCREEHELDPESVLEWRRPFVGSRRSLRYKARDEFFNEFVKSGWVKTAEAAEVLWLAFMKHCLNWLVNQQKPVDMGFCQLCPVPLRANWKALLLQAHLKSSVAPPSTNGPRLLGMIAAEVTKPEFNAWEKPHRLIWNLEVIPEPAWYRAIAEYELQRARYRDAWHNSRMNHYCAFARDSIKRALPYLTRLYAAYLSNIKKPGARFRAVILPSGKASKAPNRCRGSTIRVDPPALVVFGPELGDLAKGAVPHAGNTRPTDQVLRTVPDFRPETPDLRESNAEIQGCSK